MRENVVFLLAIFLFSSRRHTYPRRCISTRETSRKVARSPSSSPSRGGEGGCEGAETARRRKKGKKREKKKRIMRRRQQDKSEGGRGGREGWRTRGYTHRMRRGKPGEKKRRDERTSGRLPWATYRIGKPIEPFILLPLLFPSLRIRRFIAFHLYTHRTYIYIYISSSRADTGV